MRVSKKGINLFQKSIRVIAINGIKEENVQQSTLMKEGKTFCNNEKNADLEKLEILFFLSKTNNF